MLWDMSNTRPTAIEPGSMLRDGRGQKFILVSRLDTNATYAHFILEGHYWRWPRASVLTLLTGLLSDDWTVAGVLSAEHVVQLVEEAQERASRRAERRARGAAGGGGPGAGSGAGAWCGTEGGTEGGVMLSRTHVLYSPGYGAGWVSWNTGMPRAAREMMLRHAGLIDAVMSGGERLTDEHPVVLAFLADLRAVGGDDPCLLGMKQLRAHATESLVRIDEYDGYELVVECGEDEWL